MLVEFAPPFSDAFCGAPAVRSDFGGGAASGSDLMARFAAFRRAAFEVCCGAAAGSFLAADGVEVAQVQPVTVEATGEAWAPPAHRSEAAIQLA